MAGNSPHTAQQVLREGLYRIAETPTAPKLGKTRLGSEVDISTSSMHCSIGGGPFTPNTVEAIRFRESLTQNPTSPNYRLPLATFETHNGRSILSAGTGLYAPKPTLLLAPG
jgi:hypothetical protein